MAIIGSIIKTAIELKETLSIEKEPQESQLEMLIHLLERGRDTEFGKAYDFKNILTADDIQKAFQEKVPYFDYHQMEKEWWYKTIEGRPNVSWPGSPQYFALSSGTTGKKSKRIPVTDEMIDAIRDAGIKQVEALANFDLPSEFFEKEMMMLGSSTDLDENNNRYEGEISGISAANIPSWFRGYYKPGEDIAKIDDWDERVEEIAERAKEWDIAGLSGIPSWMEMMMQKVMEHHNAETIHDVWPNLQVYTSGGVAFSAYEKSFNKLLKQPITIIDTYLASEGFIAYQQRPETTAMKLVLDNGIYFEFVPFEPEYILEDGSLDQNAPVLTIDKVEKDKDYVLLISTVSGAWRYLIGDTIAFTDVERAEIKITGRTKFFLNVVGSQLSVSKMDAALRSLEDQHDVEIPEFTLAATRIDDEFYHHWYLGINNATHIKETQIAEDLDQLLSEANNNYKVARTKALKGVKVTIVPTDVFTEWNGHQKKKGGQVKMARVMKEEKFKEWEEFVASQKTL